MFSLLLVVCLTLIIACLVTEEGGRESELMTRPTEIDRP